MLGQKVDEGSGCPCPPLAQLSTFTQRSLWPRALVPDAAPSQDPGQNSEPFFPSPARAKKLGGSSAVTCSPNSGAFLVSLLHLVPCPHCPHLVQGTILPPRTLDRHQLHSSYEHTRPHFKDFSWLSTALRTKTPEIHLDYRTLTQWPLGPPQPLLSSPPATL